MYDPQPHRRHINDRNPRPLVPTPDTATNSDDGDGDSNTTDEEADEEANEISPFFSTAFSAITPNITNGNNEDKEADEEASEISPFFSAAFSPITSDVTNGNNEDKEPEQFTTSSSRNRVLQHNISRSSGIARHHRTRRARLPDSLNPGIIASPVSLPFTTTTRNARADPSPTLSPYFSTPDPAATALFMLNRRHIRNVTLSPRRRTRNSNTNELPTPTSLRPRTVMQLRSNQNTRNPHHSNNPVVISSDEDEYESQPAPTVITNLDTTVITINSSSSEEEEHEDDEIIPTTPEPDDGDIVRATPEPNNGEIIPATPDPLQDLLPLKVYRRCLYGQISCNFTEGQPKCDFCTKSRIKYYPTTVEEQSSTKDCCHRCAKTPKALTCTKDSLDPPCNHCIESNNHLTCVKKRPYRRAVLPIKQRCYTCQKTSPQPRKNITAVQCDGEYPYNICTLTGRTCISKENKDNPPYNVCISVQRTCNRDQPCSNCAKINIACGRFSNNGTQCETYYTSGTLNQVSLDKCTAYQKSGRDCAGGHPYIQCLTLPLSQHSHKVCVFKINDNALRSREKAAYSVTDPDGDYTITFNPDFKGNHVHPQFKGRQKQPKHSPSKLDNEDLEDKDILNEDLLTLSAPNLHSTTHHNITIVDQLDADLADIKSIPSDESYDNNHADTLNEDLADLTFVIVAPLASSIRIPNTYKEAITTPHANG